MNNLVILQSNGILVDSIISVRNWYKQLCVFIGSFSQNQSTHAPGAIATPSAPTTTGPQTFPSNGLESHANASIPNANGNSNPLPTPSNNANPTVTSTSHLQHPQTPAQQVLISAADRWGLLSLIAMMRNANSEADHGLSTIGTDLGTMGLDMGYPGWVSCLHD